MVTHWPGHTLAEIERDYILETLAMCGGNRTRAATHLDISVRGLRIKLHRYAEDGFAIPVTSLQRIVKVQVAGTSAGYAEQSGVETRRSV